VAWRKGASILPEHRQALRYARSALPNG
jgi:hypothetical protein